MFFDLEHAGSAGTVHARSVDVIAKGHNAAFWRNKRVVVTGGGGFLGSHVVEQLRERQCEEIIIPRSREYDLREREAIIRLYEASQPDLVIHLAGVVGGIGANRELPGTFLYDNAIMGLQVMEYARRFEVQKFVCIGTVCAYPKHTPVPFREQELWNGYPEETNAPYGLAKKLLLVQAQAYRQQHGFSAIYLLPTNLYGPRDNFDPKTSHVIPALIRKCQEAIKRRDDELVIWGTGRATRDFLYVEDAAEGILLAAERYDEPGPVNLGSGREMAIRELVEIIVELTGFRGTIAWDTSKPDGQPRRSLDSSLARRAFGWQAATSFEEGLSRTIEWYRVHVQGGGKAHRAVDAEAVEE